MSAYDPKRIMKRRWAYARLGFIVGVWGPKCDIIFIPDVSPWRGRSHEATGIHRICRLHRRRVAAHGAR